MSISLSRETIQLMLQSQRIIKKEFGVRIELDDDQVMARVFAYAAQSSSNALKDCAKLLMQQLLPRESGTGDEVQTAPQTTAARVYRGQVIAENVATPESAKAVAQEKGSSGKTVIYRGQKITL
jgi:hypothetical protein